MSVEEATQCLKDMLGSEDAVEEEALRSTVSAFGGSVIAQLKNPELKALGAALQWESTTGGNSVLIPKVFAWLEGRQEAAPPTDVLSRPPTPNLSGSEQSTFYSSNSSSALSSGQVNAMVASALATQRAEFDHALRAQQQSQMSYFESVLHANRPTSSPSQPFGQAYLAQTRGGPVQSQFSNPQHPVSSHAFSGANVVSDGRRSNTETATMMAELQRGTTQALMDLGYAPGPSASAPRGVASSNSPRVLSHLGFTSEDVKASARTSRNAPDDQADDFFDQGRLHHALGDKYTAPGFIQDTYRRYPTMFSRVTQGMVWKQHGNRREAANLACVLDYLVQGDKKDAVEVLVSRLQAVIHADDKGNWQIARHLESMATQDMGSFVAAAPLRAAIRTANLYERASVYERKDADEQDPDLVLRGPRRRV